MSWVRALASDHVGLADDREADLALAGGLSTFTVLCWYGSLLATC